MKPISILATILSFACLGQASTREYLCKDVDGYSSLYLSLAIAPTPSNAASLSFGRISNSFTGEHQELADPNISWNHFTKLYIENVSPIKNINGANRCEECLQFNIEVFNIPKDPVINKMKRSFLSPGTITPSGNRPLILQRFLGLKDNGKPFYRNILCSRLF